MDTEDRFPFSSYFLSFVCVFLLSLIYSSDSFSQRKTDVGIFAGTSYYMGDLNPRMHFYSPSIAVGPVFRYNFHMRSAIRVSGIYHSLSGTDSDFNNGRGADFRGEFIDFAASYEFNFLPYKSTNTRKYKYSLYTAGGIGYHYLLNGDPDTMEPMKSHFTLPFSIGFKFNVDRRLSAGIEWSPRKVFTDRGIDGVQNIGEEESNLHLLGNNDWYTFAGVFITYKIFNYREDCPTYD